jgi:FtsP/CotA-like multicopper oxidase with cupredoxin domain
LIIEDQESDALGLPSDYGVNDIPLILQERRIDSQGRLVYARGMPDVMHGIVGNQLLVNGAIDPVITLPRDLVRLRVLNGSDSSIFLLELRMDGDPVELAQIATDGGLISSPHRTRRQVLATGERSEVLIDLRGYRGGDELSLTARSHQGPQYRALRIRVGDDPAVPSSVGLPDRLASAPPRAVPDHAVERLFEMSTIGPSGRLTINGASMDLGRIDFEVTRGTTEVWRITNPARGMMALPHTFHIHNGQFALIDIDGEPPPPPLSGWKDTFLVWPGQELRVRVRFDDYLGVYMYHCHFLVHEDAGMMGQFEVIAR